jgi:5'-nucleotidase
MTVLTMLLTGDQSPDEVGLRTLHDLAAPLGKVLTVVPHGPNSFSGHRVTVHRSLLLKRHAAEVYSLTGTPVDCVRIALRCLNPSVDWILSGINPGGNLGSEIYSSATVAAAREAALLGYKAMAISHLKSHSSSINWQLAARRIMPLVRALLQRPLEKGCFWNINIPHVPDEKVACEVVFRPLDPNPLEIEYAREGNTFKFLGQRHRSPLLPGHDVESALTGNITVTRLSIYGGSTAGMPLMSYGGMAEPSGSHDGGGEHGSCF